MHRFGGVGRGGGGGAVILRQFVKPPSKLNQTGLASTRSQEMEEGLALHTLVHNSIPNQSGFHCTRRHARIGVGFGLYFLKRPTRCSGLKISPNT